jgi:hypothetical protein
MRARVDVRVPQPRREHEQSRRRREQQHDDEGEEAELVRAQRHTLSIGTRARGLTRTREPPTR